MISCTIVIPTHNRDDLLVRAVRSALQACPADGEVLVVDDKSDVPALQVLAPVIEPRLRVIVNPGPSGAASARNFGVSQATGKLIFFLDDDDEILPDYCERVLHVADVSCAADWGFASIIERNGTEQAVNQSQLRLRQRQGVVPANAPLKDRLAAVGDGLWIRRQTFEQVDGFAREQVIDEDTDLCLRLLARNLHPWCETAPGTIIYRGYVPASQKGAQLTASTASLTGLDCYRRTYDRNAGYFSSYSRERWFLGTRFLRRAAKQGQHEVGWNFVRGLSPFPLRAAAAVFLAFKLLSYRAR